jgi:hypothetical protein
LLLIVGGYFAHSADVAKGTSSVLRIAGSMHVLHRSVEECTKPEEERSYEMQAITFEEMGAGK